MNEKANLYHNEAIRQTQEQYESRRHFDSMAIQILGFSSVVFGLLLVGEWQFKGLQVWLLVASLVFFSVVAICTISALWLRKWEFSPPLSDLYKNMESKKYSDEELILWSGQSLSDAISSNDKQLRSKAHFLRFAYLSLALEVLAIGILVLSSFICV
jgi:hypothetical protein